MKRLAFGLVFLLAMGCGDADEEGSCEVEGRWLLSYVPVGHACELEPEILGLERDERGEWAPAYGPRKPDDPEEVALTSYFFYDSEACLVEHESSAGWIGGGEVVSESRSLELTFSGETGSGTLERRASDPCLEDLTRTYEVRAKRL